MRKASNPVVFKFEHISELLRGFVRQVAGPTAKVSDSVSQGWAQEFIYLISPG